MHSTVRVGAVGLGLLGFLVACGASRPALRYAPAAELQRGESVAQWQALARPDSLALLGTLLSLVEQTPGPCPTRSQQGRWTVLNGGCTDDSGEHWTGRARMRSDDTQLTAVLDGFGRNGDLTDGRMELRAEPSLSFDMNVHVIHREGPGDGPGWMALDVRGRRDANDVWSGEGRLATDELGRVRMEARGIVLDSDRCEHEPVRGQLELWSAEQHVQIHYDGQDDCDSPGTARWVLDGVEQGEISGVGGALRCTPGSNGSIPAGEGLMLAMLGLRRRRVPSVREAQNRADRRL